MSTEHLKQTLTDLHAALTSGARLDPELVALLNVLDADIRTALAQSTALRAGAPAAPGQPLDPVAPRPAATTGAGQGDGLTSRAQALSAKFAARHPHLEPVLRELTDTLQRIGI